MQQIYKKIAEVICRGMLSIQKQGTTKSRHEFTLKYPVKTRHLFIY
jgi:hypothetical protein